jgi:molybdopterin converting factor small subunit
MASIRIPTPLRPYTAGQEHVSVDGATVGEALKHLIIIHPELEQHLFNEGDLRSFVNVFVGDEDIRYLKGVETPITGDTKMLIIPSIAGGVSENDTKSTGGHQ